MSVMMLSSKKDRSSGAADLSRRDRQQAIDHKMANTKKNARGTKAKQTRRKSPIEQPKVTTGSEEAGRSLDVEALPPCPAGLTDKEWMFVLLYTSACWLNGTRAAIAAGYSEKSARSIASENLAKPDIRQAVDDRLKAFQMGADEVLARIADKARASLEDFLHIQLDPKGEPADVRLDLAKAARLGKMHLLKKITFHEMGGVKSIELWDSQAADRDLGRHHKLFIDRVDVTSLGKKVKGYVGISPDDWDEPEADRSGEES